MAGQTLEIQRTAGLELNALRLAGVLGEEYEKVRVPASGTPIFDITGVLLYHRLPLTRGRDAVASADIAVEPIMGEPLLAVSMGLPWNEKELLAQATSAARKGRRGLKFDRTRFVAYSYPKVGVQFLLDDKEVLLLELGTWAEVPPARMEQRSVPPKEGEQPAGPFPGNFDRWSVVEETPSDIRRARERSYARRLRAWDVPALRRLDVRSIVADRLKVRDLVIRLVDTHELHYSPRNADHHTCYELRGQQTNVWCVGASAEMLLNFYRYQYDQIRLAQELGLGTLNNPNGLPYARVGDVVTVLENLTSNALDVTMHVNPSFDIFRNEILVNRPLISFVPSHSRTVAGYTRNLLAIVNQLPFRGLLVYDPWPPNVGVITRWENVATQTYQYAYSAVLRHI
jgi:hypothetical protein